LYIVNSKCGIIEEKCGGSNMIIDRSLDMMRLAQSLALDDNGRNEFAAMRQVMLAAGEEDGLIVRALSCGLNDGLSFGTWPSMKVVVQSLPKMRPPSLFELYVAQAVLEAARLREESYDEAAAAAAAAEYDKRQETFETENHGKTFLGFSPDFAKFYRMTIEEACEEAAGPLGRLIYLALDGWWNDAIGWAQQMTDPDGTVAPGLTHCQHGTVWPPNPTTDEMPEPVDPCPKCTEFWADCQRADCRRAEQRTELCP
jgi:hypothetical protein